MTKRLLTEWVQDKRLLLDAINAVGDHEPLPDPFKLEIPWDGLPVDRETARRKITDALKARTLS